jgi:hypothetical protein
MSNKKMNWPLGILFGLVLGGVTAFIALADQSVGVRVGAACGVAVIATLLVAMLNARKAE